MFRALSSFMDAHVENFAAPHQDTTVLKNLKVVVMSSVMNSLTQRYREQQLPTKDKN